MIMTTYIYIYTVPSLGEVVHAYDPRTQNADDFELEARESGLLMKTLSQRAK